jgi:tRNA threonylcarbamoyladenosine biosynthesis protein TsaE
MRAAVPDTLTRTRRLADVGATARLAEALSGLARRGDVIGLAGDLGIGKTTFARAFIEACARSRGASIEEVPSPTFTLVQIYEFDDLAVAHFDLYRIERAEETYELGLDDAIADGVVLIEWPDRLEGLLPPDRLDVVLGPGAGPDQRIATLAGRGDWASRISGIADDDDA